MDSSRTELMAKLAELTEGMASEVGKHSGNIEAINAELAAVKDGDAGAVVAAVKKILRANAQMQQELQIAETRLQEQQQELVTQTEAARTDQLTKITNRRALDEELKKCVQEFQHSAQPFSLMVVDVDHFKRFNDTHGHLAGDEVLKFVAETMKSQTRESDLVARYGGEEFVVVFRGESVSVCRERADQLRASINGNSLLKAKTGSRAVSPVASGGRRTIGGRGTLYVSRKRARCALERWTAEPAHYSRARCQTERQAARASP
jgi:diguanylate cyclase